jgi:hypothetical protein
MIAIVCLDDQDGMLFHNRRQSMDSRVREYMIELCGEKPLWMNRYSAGQFSQIHPNFCIDEDFLEKAGFGEYCFLENVDAANVADMVEGIVIFRWNRRYPADMRFPTAIFSQKWTRIETKEFPGSSHERITLEVYRL